MDSKPLSNLSSVDIFILNTFRDRLYLSRAHLIAETVAAIKDETGRLSWVEFSPTFHARLMKMAFTCIGTPLTLSSSLIAKKAIFLFILELLNAGTTSYEPYFNTNTCSARKKKTHKHSNSVEQEKQNPGQYTATVSITPTDKTSAATTRPDPPTPTPSAAQPLAKPSSQPNQTTPTATEDLIALSSDTDSESETRSDPHPEPTEDHLQCIR